MAKRKVVVRVLTRLYWKKVVSRCPLNLHMEGKEAFGDSTPRKWFKKFGSGDIDIKEKPR